MRLYRRSRREAGKVRQSGNWHVGFRDHAGADRTLRLFTDRSTSAAFAGKLDRLIAARMAHEPLDGNLSIWLERMPDDIRGKLAEWGILDGARAASGKPLTEHVENFGAALKARGATEDHASQTAERVRELARGCGFARWSEIDAARVLSHLAARRQAPKGRLSAATSNAYLAAFKSFARWMVAERRATQNPIAHLKGMNARPDRQRERRALSADECRRLIAAASEGAAVLGMPGPDRAMLYRLALESGLRWNELRTLTAGSFRLDADPTVTVEAAYSKHRRQDVLPLRHETAAALMAYLSLKLPGAPAFPMPAADGAGAIVVRADLASARAAWLHEAEGNAVEHEAREQSDTLKDVDSAGRMVDFHALRHTFISNLAAAGVHPKIAQTLARHSTIGLTMDRYTHLEVASQTAALDALPDLSAAPAEVLARTGTDDRGRFVSQKPLTGNLTEVCGQLGTFSDGFGQSAETRTEDADEAKNAENTEESSDSGASEHGAPGRSRTPDRRIRNPLLCPSELVAHPSR